MQPPCFARLLVTLPWRTCALLAECRVPVYAATFRADATPVLHRLSKVWSCTAHTCTVHTCNRLPCISPFVVGVILDRRSVFNERWRSAVYLEINSSKFLQLLVTYPRSEQITMFARAFHYRRYVGIDDRFCSFQLHTRAPRSLAQRMSLPDRRCLARSSPSFGFSFSSAGWSLPLAHSLLGVAWAYREMRDR